MDKRAEEILGEVLARLDGQERATMEEALAKLGDGERRVLGRMIENEDGTFLYEMIDRLRCDCNYFLGHGNRYEPGLWARSVEKHIAMMRAAWLACPAGEKPEWLPFEAITEYERKMSGGGEGAAE